MRSILYIIFISIFLGVLPAQGAGWQLKFAMSNDPDGKAALYPAGMYIDQASERYYIVDTGNNRLLSFDKTGAALHAFDANKSLKTPLDMVRDRDGNIIVIERGRNSLTIIDLKKKKVLPHKMAGIGVFPQRLSVIGGDIYILDKVPGAVLRLDGSFKIQKRYKCPDCTAGFIDMQILTNGDIAALNRDAGEVFKFAKTGGVLERVKLRPPPEFASSFTISPRGKIFVAERFAGKIKIYTPAGEFIDDFLTKGEGAEQIFYPSEIGFDPWGRLCVLDEGNGRLAVFGR